MHTLTRSLYPLLTALLLLASWPEAALAVPPLPSSFYGTVQIDGANVPDGTTVSAWINGNLYQQTTTFTDGGNSVYTMSVPGDDPATGAVEGGVNGDTVTFVVDGQTATPTGTWQSGTNVERNLGVTSTPPVAVEAPADMTADLNATVQIPITLPEDVTGKDIYGWVFTLTFDETIITPNATPVLTSGTLSGGWVFEPNTGTAGQIRVAAYGLSSLAGSGVLVTLQFDTANSGGAVTALTFTDFLFNEGVPGAQTSNGQLTIGTLSLGGNVIFAVDNRPVANVELSADGPAPTVGSTGASGVYGLTIDQMGNYTVVPAKSGYEGGSISGLDASLVLQHVAGTATLNGRQQTVADVSADGTITTYDVSLIGHHAASKTPPTPSRAGAWTFSPASRDYEPLNSDLSGENYTADLYGDVSGNWGESVGRARHTIDATLTLPTETAVAAGQTVLVPVSVDGVDAHQIWAYRVEVIYDENLLRALESSTGSARDGGLAVVNAEKAGRVILVGYSARPLAGDGALFDLAFEALGKEGERGRVEIVSLRWNEEAVQEPVGGIGAGDVVIRVPSNGWLFYLPTVIR